MSVKKESLSISRKKSLKKEKTEEDSFSKLVTSASSELEESTKDMACDASTTSKMIDTSRLELMITAAAAQGGRRYMEDRIHVVVKRDQNGQVQHVFAGIYDGHGGPQASQYVCTNLYNNIINNELFQSETDADIMSAIKEGFQQTNDNMLKVLDLWPLTSSGHPCTAGTTASCVLIRNGKLYTGHVGDSFIMLANFDETEAGHNDAQLTEDHRPDSARERERIELAGGEVVSQKGMSRVVWNRPSTGPGPIRRSTSMESIPFLAVARSLGDFWSLNPDNGTYVISPVPDVDVFQLKSTDKFIVLCTDGVSNVVGTRSIVQLLKELSTSKFEGFRFLVPPSNSEKLVNFAHYILNFTFTRWGMLRADNISIICIELSDTAPKQVGNKQHLLEEDPQMDVNIQLSKQPTSIVRIGKTTTQQFSAHSPSLVYAGPIDRAVQLRSRNGDDSTRSDNGGFIFEGPGFVVPECVVASASSEENSDVDEGLLPPLPLQSLYGYLPTRFQSAPANKNDAQKAKRKSMPGSTNSSSKDPSSSLGTMGRSSSFFGVSSRLPLAVNNLFGSSISEDKTNKPSPSSLLSTPSSSFALNSNLLNRFVPFPTPPLFSSPQTPNSSASSSKVSNSSSDRSNKNKATPKSDIHPLISTTRAFGASPASSSGNTTENKNKGLTMSPLATRLQQGVKRRLYEEQDENEVNNGGEQNPNSIALLGALQEPPTKKPKHPVERIISQSKRRIFGGKKGPQQQSTNEEASVQVANPPNLPVTNFSNPNSPTAASSSGAGGGGVRRGIWNFLSFLMKPFSSPSPPQSQHH